MLDGPSEAMGPHPGMGEEPTHRLWENGEEMEAWGRREGEGVMRVEEDKKSKEHLFC